MQSLTSTTLAQLLVVFTFVPLRTYIVVLYSIKKNDLIINPHLRSENIFLCHLLFDKNQSALMHAVSQKKMDFY